MADMLNREREASEENTMQQSKQNKCGFLEAAPSDEKER